MAAKGASVPAAWRQESAEVLLGLQPSHVGNWAILPEPQNEARTLGQRNSSAKRSDIIIIAATELPNIFLNRLCQSKVIS